MSNELKHHGVKGMRWGVRRSPKQLGHDTKKTKTRKRLSELTDDELSTKVKRMEMEKKYKDLDKSLHSSRGKNFIVDVLEASGKNILTQTTVYLGGKAVNKLLGMFFEDQKAINPKKGQKEK